MIANSEPKTWHVVAEANASRPELARLKTDAELKVHAVLTDLRLWNNSIGDDGAKAIAEVNIGKYAPQFVRHLTHPTSKNNEVFRM